MKPLILILSVLLLASPVCASDIKDADLAGSWYPASKEALTLQLQGYLDKAVPPKVDGTVYAVIAPHAGYQFSGPVAAYSYKAAALRPVKTVVLIGFSHRKSFDGISVYDRGSFRTPLGEIAVDAKLASEITAANPRIRYYPAAFDEENSVEMQIPFIQLVFKGATIVPIAFGGQSYGDAVILADALAAALKPRGDYLIVASTDLSHYHGYDEANAIDARLAALLRTMKARDIYDSAITGSCEMCGLMPVTATVLAAQKLGFGNVSILKYANSGDTYGDKSKVVGYLSAVFYRPADPVTNEVAGGTQEKTKAGGEKMLLNQAQRARLLAIARESITGFVKSGKRIDVSEKDPVLNEPMGAFVTLHEKGELRGCIGNMTGQGPLYKTVAAMAIEAATGDPRFMTLSPEEIDTIDIEISVLSPMRKVKSADEITIPGHGVLVRRGFRSGVYLPQVATETGWTKEEFLTSLCGQKAGLSPDAWRDPSTDMYVFTAEVFGEKEGGR